VFVEVLTRLSVLMVERSRAVRNAPHTYEIHRRIADAVIAGDVAGAQRLMREHLDEVEAGGNDQVATPGRAASIESEPR
jgi:DNA-binding FadR family transcriptional regulator